MKEMQELFDTNRQVFCLQMPRLLDSWLHRHAMQCSCGHPRESNELGVI